MSSMLVEALMSSPPALSTISLNSFGTTYFCASSMASRHSFSQLLDFLRIAADFLRPLALVGRKLLSTFASAIFSAG